MKGLQREIEELERTDPDVAAAKAKYDATVAKILAKPCVHCGGSGLQFNHTKVNGEWGDRPEPCRCQRQRGQATESVGEEGQVKR